MRKALLVSGVAVGAVVLIAAALVGYAFLNLSSIVEKNHARIVARVSEALGRPVQIAQIQAHAGWGVTVEVTGLKVGDDPDFSQPPFIVANQVSVDVEFLPLLRGEARVKKLRLIKPEVRIIAKADGALNLGSIGVSSAEKQPPTTRHARMRASLADLSVAAISIEDGAIYYADLSGTARPPVEVHHLDVEVDKFNPAARFDLDAKFAFAADQQNVELSGKLGPLLHRGVIDRSGLPLDLKFSATSIIPDRMRTLPAIGSYLPADLSVPDPVAVSGTITGTPAAIAFSMGVDLSKARVTYAGLFNKPQNSAMVLDGNGLWGKQLEIASANLKLLDLDLTASRISLTGVPTAQIDTNSFSLANLTPMLAAASGYVMSGNSEVHGIVKLTSGRPSLDGTVTLKQAALKLGPKWPAGISNLNAKVLLSHGHAVIQPSQCAIGSAHWNFEGRVESITPLVASYALKTDSMKLSELFASRPRDEVANQLTINGSADGSLGAPGLRATIKSSDGFLANAPYRNLEVAAAYKDGRASTHPLDVEIFDGSLAMDTDVVLDSPPRFNATIRVKNIRVEQALRSQALSAANTLQGLLSVNVSASGRGSSWDQIKPTLSGNGRSTLANGKLIGVNIVAGAINAVAAAPGVSQLMSVAFMSSHHGVLIDPDTELKEASMSFQLAGERFTTHDLMVRSPDYSIRGDGWFDMDKNIDMKADISFVYGLGIAVPVMLSGKLPSVLVLPDVPTLAQRAVVGVVNAPAHIIRGGADAVGGIVGGAAGAAQSLPNPLDTLKGWMP